MRPAPGHHKGVVQVHLGIGVQLFARFDGRLGEGDLWRLGPYRVLAIRIGVSNFYREIFPRPGGRTPRIPRVHHQDDRRLLQHAELFDARRDRKRRLIPALAFDGGRRFMFEIPQGARVRGVMVDRNRRSYGSVSDSLYSSICSGSQASTSH